MKNVPFNFEDYNDEDTRTMFAEEHIGKLTGDDLADVFDDVSDTRLKPLLAAIATMNHAAVGGELLDIIWKYLKDVDDESLEDFARGVHRDLCEAPDDL